MTTNPEKIQSSPITEEARILVRKFKLEMLENGSSTVICPECGKRPQIMSTPQGERTTIACECGYIYDSEFNL